MQIKLLVDAGAMKPGPALSQKLGPLGVNMGKVISEVNNATKDFKGMKVPAILDIDGKTKNVTVKVMTPPVSELLKKEVNVLKGSQQPHRLKVANLPIETIIKVAKIKEKDILSGSFKAAVKTVLGSCVATGFLVESKEPKEVMEEINKGTYDSLINNQTEQASQEKLDKLNGDFELVKKKQEVILREIEAKKEEKAAAKASGAEGAAKSAEAVPADAKKEEKPKK
jgi:large subunit ribosomal protein L11